MTSVAVVTNRKKVNASASDALRKALTNAGFGDARWYEAKGGSAATPATECALADGANVVIAAGGDGTVRGCAHALAGTDAALAVMPTGTANLFASALDLPSDADAVVELLTSGAVRTLDVGVCNGMRFVVMAGSGFDASLMKAVDDGPKDRFGTLAYVWAGLREVRRREPLNVRVTVDGSRFYNGLATCVLVGNLGRLKAGVFAFPEASPVDGRLEVGVVSASTAMQWLGVAGRVLLRRPQASRRVQLGSGSTIDVEWAPKAAGRTKKRARKMPYELDGGAKGSARKLHYACEPRSLRVLVPAEAGR